MNSYKVASMEYGTRTEKWFDDKKAALRFAKSIATRGFEPLVMEYPNHDYSNGKEIAKASTLWHMFRLGW